MATPLETKQIQASSDQSIFQTDVDYECYRRDVRNLSLFLFVPLVESEGKGKVSACMITLGENMNFPFVTLPPSLEMDSALGTHN